jgi:hypothetical protein
VSPRSADPEYEANARRPDNGIQLVELRAAVDAGSVGQLVAIIDR